MSILLFLLSCGDEKDSSEDNQGVVNPNENDLSLSEVGVIDNSKMNNYNLSFIDTTFSEEVFNYIDSILILKKQMDNVPFTEDTSFLFLEKGMDDLSDVGWKIFYVKGLFLPSQSEFLIFGGYKDYKRNCFGYIHSVLEIYWEINNCEASTEFLLIKGKLPNENEDLEDADNKIIATYHPNINMQY